MVYIKEIFPKTSYPKFILQDNGMKFNEQLIPVFDSLSIKCVYSTSYYPKGNGKIENIHNLLKCTTVKFTYDSQPEWNDTLPLATYCHNITPIMDDLTSLFYLVHGRDLPEGRLSNLQNYYRYVGDQPGHLAVQELRKMWKVHTKLLMETRITEPINTRKVTKATDLKIGQLVLVKDHFKGPADPSYIFDHGVAGIINGSSVLLTTPDGKEKRCNIHHIKLITALEASASVFQMFQDGIQKDPGSAQLSHSYNLCSKRVLQ